MNSQAPSQLRSAEWFQFSPQRMKLSAERSKKSNCVHECTCLRDQSGYFEHVHRYRPNVGPRSHTDVKAPLHLLKGISASTCTFASAISRYPSPHLSWRSPEEITESQLELLFERIVRDTTAPHCDDHSKRGVIHPELAATSRLPLRAPQRRRRRRRHAPQPTPPSSAWLQWTWARPASAATGAPDGANLDTIWCRLGQHHWTPAIGAVSVQLQEPVRIYRCLWERCQARRRWQEFQFGDSPRLSRRERRQRERERERESARERERE